MNQCEYVAWLSQSGRRADRQRQYAHWTMGTQSVTDSSVANVEQRVGEGRRCRHCQPLGVVRSGEGCGGGLQRYRCNVCRRTFIVLTGTPLSGLHYKDRWPAVGYALAQRESIRAMAKRCRVHVSTVFRWQHRFLEAVGPSPERLSGIVKVNETFVRTNEKEARNLNRPPRRWGQPAGHPRRSKDQVPVLMAVDHGGATCSHVLPDVTAVALVHELRGWVQSTPCWFRMVIGCTLRAPERWASGTKPSICLPVCECAAPRHPNRQQSRRAEVGNLLAIRRIDRSSSIANRGYNLELHCPRGGIKVPCSDVDALTASMIVCSA